MNVAAENKYEESNSIGTAWQHCKEAFLASSPAAAWESFKEMVHALPMWALVLTAVLAVVCVSNPTGLPTFFTHLVLLVAIYFTVKQAVRDGQRQPPSS